MVKGIYCDEVEKLCARVMRKRLVCGIGVKQRLLLRRCLLKGWIDTGDVGIYYPVLDGRKRIAELQKLAVRGLITPCGRRWYLTEKGKHVLRIGV